MLNKPNIFIDVLKTENYLMLSLFLQDFNISHNNQHSLCQKCWREDDDINAQDDNTGFDGTFF